MGLLVSAVVEVWIVDDWTAELAVIASKNSAHISLELSIFCR